MSRGGKRRAKVVLRAAGGSRQQSNIPDYSDTAACSDEADDIVFKSAYPWNTLVSNSQDLEKTNHVRSKLKKEIFGMTFENDKLSYKTPLHSQIVSKHQRLPSCSYQEHKIPTNSVSELSSFIPWDPSRNNSDYIEVDYHVVTVNNCGSTEVPNTVRLGQRYSEEHSHSLKKNIGSPLHTSSSDSHSPLTHSLRARNADLSSSVNQQQLISPTQRQSSKATNIGSSLRPGSEEEVESSISRQEQTLLSTNYAMSSAFLTITTPLLTSNLRKGGRRPSEDTHFDFDAEQQLERCFTDKKLQVMVVTWNMQEQKVFVYLSVC